MTLIAEWVVRRRGWVIAAWLLLAAALAPFAARVQRELEVTARIQGSEASAVDSALTNTFQSPFAQYAILVASNAPDPATPAGRDVLGQIVRGVEAIPQVTATFSYLTAGDTLFRTGARGTLLVVGLDAGEERLDAIIPRLRDATRRLSGDLAPVAPGMTLRWTGGTPVNYDIRASSARDVRAAELRVLPLTLVLLIAAFGAVVAGIIPLIAAALTIVSALGVAALINLVWPMSVVLQNIVSMIGLGVGIDYALLTISRFRESLATGRSPDEAATDAARHAGGTIALSGATVMIGFAALLAVPLNEIQSVGVGGMLVVGFSVLMALTFLPAALALLGPRVDALRIGRRASGAPMSDLWRQWAERVVRRPFVALAVALVPSLLLAWPTTRLITEMPRGKWLPPGMESALAIGDLERMGRGGMANSLRILVELPLEPKLVQALPSIPATPLRPLLSADGRFAVIDVVPHDSLDTRDMSRLVRDIRARVSDGSRVRVGGIPALSVDSQDAINSRFSSIVGLVVAATTIALMIGFRSVLIPVKAVLLNLLSVAVAYGAVVLVFQEGHGVGLLGLDAPLGGVFPAVPILVFCIVFGLSMDYEVFLVSRVAEARRRLDERQAVVEGVERTGGVITSAAAIMIVVFAAFALGDFQFIKILGFALAVAVLVDATLVRMALGPALLVIAGRWNWWPGGAPRESSRIVS
jgi:RND superfamily putative drug exporter